MELRAATTKARRARAPTLTLTHPRPRQSGGLASAHLHVARTVYRRAERRAVSLAQDGELAPEVVVFLNRLSDYLFVAARFACLKSGGVEEVYKKGRGLECRAGGGAAEA